MLAYNAVEFFVQFFAVFLAVLFCILVFVSCCVCFLFSSDIPLRPEDDDGADSFHG